MKNAFNIIGFQISWWACVIATKHEIAYFGPMVMLIFLAVHLYHFSSHEEEYKLILIFGFIGTFVDTLLFQGNILGYLGSYGNSKVAPLWITAMWCGFAATVNHSMIWFKDRWIESIFVGVVGGPLAYATGEKFSVIHFKQDFITVSIILAIIWGISIPLMFWVNDKINIKSR